MVGCDGGRELVWKLPVQGDIGAGRAVVDFKEVALRAEQIEAEIVGDFEHSGVFVGVGGHQPQRAQIVQERGGISYLAIQAGDARGLFADDGRHHAVHPDFTEGGRAHRGAHHIIKRDEGRHRPDAFHAEPGDGLGQAGDLALGAEQRGVSEPEQLGGE
jgi:hypothetical protein